MKKYFVYLVLALVIISCNQDTDQRKIENSFKQFLHSLKVEDMQEAEKLAPFLAGISGEESVIILKPFRALNKTKYKLEISRVFDDIYYLHVKTGNSDSLWYRIELPYKQNSEDQWIMAPIIKSFQTFDIIPVQQ